MSDNERTKSSWSKSKIYSKESSKTYCKSPQFSKDKDFSLNELKQPTILLKSKDTTTDDSVNSCKNKPKDIEPLFNGTKENDGKEVPTHIVKSMSRSMKLIEDGSVNTDILQDYLDENNDFTVVGVIGKQSVGKSTLLNLLSSNKVTSKLKKKLFLPKYESSDEEIDVELENTNFEEKFNTFAIQKTRNKENCRNRTHEIDIYISNERIIFLDCQPVLSGAILDDLLDGDSKFENSLNECISLENKAEILGLQYVGFLMSVCHVLLVVQDWFFDSNFIRFILAAEMLKPTISNPEDNFTEYFPHIIMIQNRAEMKDFTPVQFRAMQNMYDKVFHKSKLQFNSNLGLGLDGLTISSNNDLCKRNLYVIPEYDIYNVSNDNSYQGYPPLEAIIKKLREKIISAPKNNLTHFQLTEKTWLQYCNKVWEIVKKNPFYVEYSKLL